MILLLWFGVCAAILASTGVYSVIAESVAARRREIAIKTALGARRSRLVRDIVTVALLFVLAGESVGMVCAVAAGRAASGVLYGVLPGNPVVLGAVVAFLFLVSLGSAVAPAWVASGEEVILR